ncbi:MAG: GGDEF domain-containing protein [Acidimicrobiales bacterium]
MGATFSDRLSQLGYVKARRLLVVTGLAVLAVVAAVMYARRVDGIEVAATLLFVPIFLAFVFRGVLGGVVTAVVAIGVYTALRTPAIDAVGVSEFTGLIVSRAAAYLIFGAVGGWSMQVLEGSLIKLELYDEVDDETGLFNARHLLHQTDLETARARRYQTLFSIVVLDMPAGPFNALKARDRRAVLRDLGRLLGEGVRTVDHVSHARDGDRHRIAVVLPETAHEGAEIFRARLDDRVRAYLSDRGVAIDGTEVPATALTFPGDDDALAAVRADFERIDATQHR